jgi:hypothetical protein
MKKIIMAMLFIALSAGIALAGGDKVRGDNGEGPTIQDFCGPDDDCGGDPYWWD